ncbi:MAG: hypothetical protein KF909_00335 [Rhodocyclaceae bacterium]|nr:hypothetical protein [Rhodocyclaceae bacterium]
MKVVIQCAGAKQPHAGSLQASDGRKVVFVACPEIAPPREGILYAHPDDPSPEGPTWRAIIKDPKRKQRHAESGLLPALDLYSNRIYGELGKAFERENVFILSAGWGLITADFLTPDYDITFAHTKEMPWTRRSKKARRFCDFMMLRADPDEDVVFLGGQAYLPLFCALTSSTPSRKIVFFNSTSPPSAHGCELSKYRTNCRTNWHYNCARDLITHFIET